mmetsp:Transcript_54488/g.129899  ORF Transcript_54488/g.129899 Transcript_54488/m.129899 type:complete len:216 (+) Transcript_54488:411-1058(+)
MDLCVRISWVLLLNMLGDVRLNVGVVSAVVDNPRPDMDGLLVSGMMVNDISVDVDCLCDTRSNVDGFRHMNFLGNHLGANDGSRLTYHNCVTFADVYLHQLVNALTQPLVSQPHLLVQGHHSGCLPLKGCRHFGSQLSNLLLELSQGSWNFSLQLLNSLEEPIHLTLRRKHSQCLRQFRAKTLLITLHLILQTLHILSQFIQRSLMAGDAHLIPG